MITFCISTYNNLPYLKLAVESVRKNSYYKDAPFIIHAENCTDGTDEWLADNEYNLEYYIEKNETPVGIGGGMNFCAGKVKTDYIMFLHSDFYVSKDWGVDIKVGRDYNGGYSSSRNKINEEVERELILEGLKGEFDLNELIKRMIEKFS